MLLLVHQRSGDVSISVTRYDKRELPFQSRAELESVVQIQGFLIQWSPGCYSWQWMNHNNPFGFYLMYGLGDFFRLGKLYDEFPRSPPLFEEDAHG